MRIIMEGVRVCVMTLDGATNTCDYLFGKLVLGSEKVAQQKPNPGKQLVSFCC